MEVVGGLFKNGHSDKQYSENVMVSEQGPFWKTTSRILCFSLKGVFEKHYSQNAMVSEQGALYIVLAECHGIGSSSCHSHCSRKTLFSQGKPVNKSKNSTFYLGTLENMQSSGFQNCPRAVEHFWRQELIRKRWSIGPKPLPSLLFYPKP